MISLEWILCILAIIIPLFVYGKWKLGLFNRMGIPCVEPSIPFLGSGLNILLQREHMVDFIQKSYDKFPDKRYYGLFEGTRPLIVIKDLDLIKEISVRDFDHFHDHRINMDEDVDPMFGKMLFSLKGEKWRDMRATLSPAFTGSKMRNMFMFVEECAEDFVDHYLKKTKEPSFNGIIEIEGKEIFQHYTNDTIATTVFGIKVNSIQEGDNTFYKMLKLACDFSGVQIIKMILYGYIPSIIKFFNLPIIHPSVKIFFGDLVQKGMKYRIENNIERHDMIQILLEAKQGSLKFDTVSNENKDYASVEESAIGKRSVHRKWTDDELTAQSLIFLLGGFETTSTLLSFLVYELAKNPVIQRKLQDEIDQVYLELKDGKLTYNDLPKLKYLDMVVTETLRLWPPGVITDRVCSKPYELPPPSESTTSTYTIAQNDAIWVPVFAIHHDKKYFPDPEKFDPERFSDENKASILPNSYLPFGIGPRNCIGSRYALMVIKAIAFNVFLKFDIEVTAKTQIPIKLATNTVNLHTQKGVWVGLKPRL